MGVPVGDAEGVPEGAEDGAPDGKRVGALDGKKVGNAEIVGAAVGLWSYSVPLTQKSRIVSMAGF